MSQLENYRQLYEYEIDCNNKMLAMIETVPAAARSDSRFQQAVSLAGHLAAVRENWLDRMEGDGLGQVDWFDETCDLSGLSTRFTLLASRWTNYLAGLEESNLAEDFGFPAWGGGTFRLQIEVQIIQLIVHAPYHRGQIALLVDQLGGETVDTDYVYWAVPESSDA